MMKKRESKILCQKHRIALFAILSLCAYIHGANALTNTSTYSYDAIGRVVGANYGGGRVITYEYDPSGNLLERRIYASNDSPEADVSVVKTAQPSPAIAGSNLFYTVVVSNAGPDAATEVTLHDDLPGVVLTVSRDFTQGDITVDGDMIDWSIGILGSNDVAQMKVVVKPIEQGSLTNTAIVSAIEYDPNLLNNTSIVVTAVSMGGDQDGDGLPDWWETMYFGGPTNANPSVDSDGDGVLNDEEYLADTNPNDPTSFFAIDAISVSPHPAIHFRTSPIRYYRLQVRGSLTEGDWITLPGTVQGDGGDVILEDQNPDPEAVYRLEVRPTP